MEVLSFLMTIIFIIFALLQIILFFRLWKMTNDVTKILQEQQESKKEIVEQIQKLVAFLSRNKNN